MNMRETVMSAAMKVACVDTDEALLRSIAVAELQRTDVNVYAALTRFTNEVRGAGGVLAKLIPYGVTRDHAREYLNRVAADMRGEGVVPAKAGDGVREGYDSHGVFGPVDNSEGGGSAVVVRGQNTYGPSPSDSVPAQAGGGVLIADESHKHFGSPEQREDKGSVGCVEVRHGFGPSSSPPNRNGAVHRSSDNRQMTSGRAVPVPKPARGLSAMKDYAAARTLFDTYQTRQGPIGDLVWSAIPRIMSENTREAALLKLIYQHARPGYANARVRDVIKETDLQRMIKKAAEISNG
jgi:hypothetical protein